MKSLVVLLALLLAACSNGGGKHAASTTTVAAATYVALSVAPCSALNPVPVATLTRRALATAVVPFVASKVRVCRYLIHGGVIERVLTSPSVVAQIESETNRLPTLPTRKRSSHAVPPDRCGSSSWYLVTFANDSQRVDVMTTVCDTASNRVLGVRTTPQWLNELQRYTPIPIVGTWRPVSITGYHGPLADPPLLRAPFLRFDDRGEWTGSDSCDILSGLYRVGSDGSFQLVELGPKAGCEPNRPSFGLPATAVRVELSNGRLTFFARDGAELAQYERANITAEVVLPSTTMTAGSSMTRHVIVESDTGGALHVIGCISLFGVALSKRKIHQTVAFRACAQRSTIPVDESSYPLTVGLLIFKGITAEDRTGPLDKPKSQAREP